MVDDHAVAAALALLAGAVLADVVAGEDDGAGGGGEDRLAVAVGGSVALAAVRAAAALDDDVVGEALRAAAVVIVGRTTAAAVDDGPLAGAREVEAGHRHVGVGGDLDVGDADVLADEEAGEAAIGVEGELVEDEAMGAGGVAAGGVDDQARVPGEVVLAVGALLDDADRGAVAAAEAHAGVDEVAGADLGAEAGRHRRPDPGDVSVGEALDQAVGLRREGGGRLQRRRRRRLGHPLGLAGEADEARGEEERGREAECEGARHRPARPV